MAAPQVRITVRQPGHPDRTVEVQGPELRMGRADDNDLPLPDSGVSRRHARVLVQGDRVVFEDNGSGNGSFVGGVRIRRHELADGDEVFIEPFTLRFSIRGLDGEPEPTAWIPDESGGEATLAMAGGGAYLEPVAGQGLEARYDIPVTGLTLGRSEQRDVVLLDSAASRLHCEILATPDGRFVLRDPGSANGTAVNGRPVREHELTHGDVILIGQTQLRFLRVEDAGASTQFMPGEGYVDKTESFGQVLSKAAPRPAAPNLAAAPSAPPPPRATPNLAAPVAPPPPAQAPAPRSPPRAAPPPEDPGSSTVAWTAEQLQAAAEASAAELPPRPAATSSGGGFGAPFGAPTGGIAAPPPDLGALPQDGGFGGAVELDIDPDAAKGGRRLKVRSSGRSSGGGFLSKPINQATLGLLVMVGLMFAYKVVRDSGVGAPAPSSPAASSNLDAVDAEEVRLQMDEGVQLFQAGRYYEANARFLSVLKLDPANESAERMGYVACEFIAVRELEEAVAGQAASAADRQAARDAALRLAEDALAGRAPVSEANEALRSALKLNPDDQALVDAQARVRGRVAAAARRAEDQKSEALESELTALAAEGRAQLDRGAWSQALATFNKVMQADPQRSTSAYAAAEDGANKARAAMRAQADAPFRRGAAIMDGGDCISARREFDEALRLDPSHAQARQRRDECQQRLLSQASDKFKEARVLENANQIERALSAYQQVISLVGDKNDPLYQKAQARINDIMQ